MKQIQDFSWHLLPIVICQVTQETLEAFPPDSCQKDDTQSLNPFSVDKTKEQIKE